MNIFEKIFLVVCSIPKGKVMTYMQVSKKAEVGNAKIVGFALHANKNPIKIPCHRVIKSNGTLAKGYAFGGITEQRKKLENEGIKFNKDKVPEKYILKT